MSVVDYAIVFAFLGGIFVVGSWFYKWIGNPDDFRLAGRSITPFILAATLAATNINLYNFVGYAGMAYQYGVSIIWHEWTGMMALVFSGLFVLPVLRRLRIHTIPEYLEMRYNRGVRALIGFIWVLRLSAWLGVILYLAVKVALNVTGTGGWGYYTLWITVFALIAIIYTGLGGMWAVALTNVLQFVLMLGAALIIVPIVMSKVGWYPGLLQSLSPEKMTYVVKDGPFNWLFILAILLLGIQWASTDQGLLQTAFSAKDIKTVNRGLILAGVIMTPIAFLTVVPGLASSVLIHNLPTPDDAMPQLLLGYIPNIVLGLVLCGLLSSQVSTISANLNATATLFTTDIYKTILKRDASDRAVLITLRIMIGVSGILMIAFAYLVPFMESAVNAYLTVIGILDMPLFIVGIFYGLLWKRTNWQGAFLGYLFGAFAGVYVELFNRIPILNFTVPDTYHFAYTAFTSASAALVVCPIISLLTPRPDPEKIKNVWRAKGITSEERQNEQVYHIIPISVGGKLSLAIVALGAALFLIGVLMGSRALPYASTTAIMGMLIYFGGALLRLQFD